MEDLIRRSDAVAILEDLQKDHLQFCLIPFRQAIEGVQALPSADIDLSEYSDKLWKNAYERGKADRPQGEWIRTFDGNEWFWYCSNCKTQWYEDDLWMGGNEFPTFCPNCGCRMRKE